MFQGNCLISYVGPAVNGLTEIKLRPQDGASFAENWFFSNPKVSREVLATALAAIATNKVVFCEIPDPATAYSAITRILIDNR